MGEAAGPAVGDATPHGRNGTADAGVAFGQASLLPGQPANTAVRTSGNDRITVAGFEKLPAAADGYSVEYWVKVNADPGGYRNIVGDGESGGDFYFMNYLTPDRRIRPHYSFAIVPPATDSNAQLTVGQTYYVVTTWDRLSGEARIYINGVLDKSITTSVAPPPSNTNNPIYLGRDNRETGGDFTLDEVAFYGRPLSAAEVAQRNAAARTAGNSVTAANGNVAFSGTINTAAGAAAENLAVTAAGAAGGQIAINGDVGQINRLGTLTLSNAAASTISTAIAGNGTNLVKQGSGTLTLSNYNTYTGGTIVDGGTLRLGAGGNVGTIRGTLTVNANGTVDYTADNTFGWDSGASVNVLNIVGGTVGGSNFGNHFWNNFQLNMTGGVLKLGGTLNELHNPTITANSSSSQAQIVPVTGSAVLRLRDNTSALFHVADGAQDVDLLVSTPITQNGSSSVTKIGAGRLAIVGGTSTNPNSFASLNVAAGPLTLGTSGSVTSLSGGVQVGNTFTTGGGSATLDIPGGDLTAAWIQLGNTASTAIAATVNQSGGSVRTTADPAESAGVRLGHYPAATTVYNLSGGTLLIDNGRYLTCAVDGTGRFNQTGGEATATRVVVNARTGSGGNGTLTVSGGRLNVGNGGIVNDGSGPAAVNLGGSGGTIRAAADFSSPLGITLSGSGANAATIDTNGFTVTLSGVLRGAGGLNKPGAGTLTLNGNNTFRGETNVAAGTLLINGNSWSGSAVANYRNQFTAGTPAAGWRYLWNSGGPISNSANYTALLPTPGGTYDVDGIDGLPGPDRGPTSISATPAGIRAVRRDRAAARRIAMRSQPSPFRPAADTPFSTVFSTRPARRAKATMSRSWSLPAAPRPTCLPSPETTTPSASTPCWARSLPET